MLEKPDVPIDRIAACLQTAYELHVRQVDFLPLGADPDTAVYRITDLADTSYFLKLRRGPFNLSTLSLPAWLREAGVQHIIAPLTTRTGQLYTSLRDFKVVLYPFVEGRNGYEVALTEPQWASLGATLKRIHDCTVPADLRHALPRETFSAEWRERVEQFLERLEFERYDEPVARDTASLLLSKRPQISAFVARADELARTLETQPLDFVVCHADLHAGNFHIASNTLFYLVDWDTLTLAPKERDLMFLGAGLLGGHLEPETEEALFYKGYGETNIDRAALAYYRYERIVQDIAVYCEQLLASDAGGEDRRQSLEYLQRNFLPGGTIELAYQADETL